MTKIGRIMDRRKLVTMREKIFPEFHEMSPIKTVVYFPKVTPVFDPLERNSYDRMVFSQFNVILGRVRLRGLTHL